MGKKRQLVLTRSGKAPGSRAGELSPMGRRGEVLASLSRFNTAPDGAPRNTGMDVLHGPGMVLEIPATGDEVTQAMVTVTDEEIALPVLLRLCKALGWSMVDLETGRSFG